MGKLGLVFLLCAMVAQGVLRMGQLTNEPDTGTDFFFTPAGKNNRSGLSREVQVADPQTAINNVNALDPPPSSSNPASINASVTGTYFESVTIPDFTKCVSASASLIVTEPFAVSCGNRQTVSWGTLINFNDGGTCVEVDGKQRVSVEVTAMIVGTEGDLVNQRDLRIEPTQAASINNVGFLVTESCSEVFCSVLSAVIGGENSALIRHDATSPNPVEYIVGNCTFFGDNQTFMEFNPPNTTDQAIVNASSIQESPDAVSTVNSTGYRVKNGRLIADNEVIQAKDVAIIEENGRFALDAIIAFGKFTVKDTAVADAAAELYVGDIEVEPTAQGTFHFLNHVGNVTPSDPGAGPINGHLGPRRFGTWRVLDITELAAFSMSNQDPTALDTPLQIEFGAAQGTGSDAVQISVLGDITINVENQYFFTFALQYGRTGAGNVSWLFFWVEINGTQVGNSVLVKLDNANSDTPIQANRTFDLAPGDVVRLFILRDSQGNNSGGLVTESSSIAINDSPSASVIVERRT